MERQGKSCSWSTSRITSPTAPVAPTTATLGITPGILSCKGANNPSSPVSNMPARLARAPGEDRSATGPPNVRLVTAAGRQGTGPGRRNRKEPGQSAVTPVQHGVGASPARSAQESRKGRALPSARSFTTLQEGRREVGDSRRLRAGSTSPPDDSTESSLGKATPDRGRESRLSSAPPPSEPDGRFSRIRLSSRWSYPPGD
jgi:hypothetical protein